MWKLSRWYPWGAPSGSEWIERWDWQTDGPISGWGLSCKRSSFGFLFSTFVFQNVPGTVLECVCICGFKRNASNLDRVPKKRDSDVLISWCSLLMTLPSISSETCDIVLVNSRIGRVSWLTVPRILLLCFSCKDCQRSIVSKYCHLFERKIATWLWRLNYFHSLTNLRLLQKIWFFRINN